MTEQGKDLIPFEGTEEAREVRRMWHNGQWYYSVIDLVGVLTDSPQPRTYWNKVKARASTEGFEEMLKQVIQLRLKSPDGKFRLTDTAITLHQNRDSQGFGNLHRDAIEAGEVGSEARKSIEERTKQPVVSPTIALAHTKTRQKRRLQAQQQLPLFDETPKE